METEEEVQEEEVQPDLGARIEEIFQAFEAKGAIGAEAEVRFRFDLEGESGGSHLLTVSGQGIGWEKDYGGEAEVGIKLSVDDFLAIADGKFDGRLAVASERIEISGDLELAEKLLGWIEPDEAVS